jgi:hypothetical protein
VFDYPYDDLPPGVILCRDQFYAQTT